MPSLMKQFELQVSYGVLRKTNNKQLIQITENEKP